MFKAYRSIFGLLSILLLLGFSLRGQERNGTISGHVTDVNQDALVGRGARGVAAQWVCCHDRCPGCVHDFQPRAG